MSAALQGRGAIRANTRTRRTAGLRLGLVSLATAVLGASGPAYAVPGVAEALLYRRLRDTGLDGHAVTVDNFVLQRDRVEMRFSGTFYLANPVDKRVTGAVFIGQGQLRAAAPTSGPEREHMQRVLHTEVLESTFRNAVLRFTDDTAEMLANEHAALVDVPAVANKLYLGLDQYLLKEYGVNLAARVTTSLLNQETPGMFFAEFNGGSRGRFDLLLDYQGRIPVDAFQLNAGEKGLLFDDKVIWMAFYALADYERGMASYAQELVKPLHYDMEIDARNIKRGRLRVQARIRLQSQVDGLRAIDFQLAAPHKPERAMRLVGAQLAGETGLFAAQEDREAGLTVFLPRPFAAGEELALVLQLEGGYVYTPAVDEEQGIPIQLVQQANGGASDCGYPLSSEGWYPRYGYLTRATFNLSVVHQKDMVAVASGVRVKTEEGPGRGERVTVWKVEEPTSLVSFGVGPFERFAGSVARESGKPLPIEYYNSFGNRGDEDFVVAELTNGITFFSKLFGTYPFSGFRALFYPRLFGQGLATMLLLPTATRANKATFSFIAHETAHQWWGNVVAWRSYRDQWLSEGFAEYSGILYAGLRDKPAARQALIEEWRTALRQTPHSLTGIGRGYMAEMGPLILGHRVRTPGNADAYRVLTYGKGALVLRMLHFLFTDPATGEGQQFFEMMRDYVKRHQTGWASTESFIAVANEHFQRTPMAKKYGITDLNWFFHQWVYESHLPSYHFEYHLEEQGNQYRVVGTLFQRGIPEGKTWYMPVPLVLHFGKDKLVRALVFAQGAATPVSLGLPLKPNKIEVDPDRWILSAASTSDKQ